MVGRIRRTTLGIFLNVVLGIVFIIAAVVVVITVNYSMRQQALIEAESKARIILDRNLATHTYFSQVMKPSIFAWSEPFRSKEYFDQTWMSSTYAIREIEKYFKSVSPSKYSFRDAAINARCPEDEADEYERAFIEKLAIDKKLVSESRIRNIDGKPYLIVLRKGEVMEASCLMCHGNPKDAPKGLIDYYGSERSFNRKVGDAVHAVSLHIPISEAYAAVNIFSWKLSAILLIVLACLFTIQYWFYRRYLFQPLNVMTEKAHQIAIYEDQGEQIPQPFGRELSELTATFNEMSVKLRHDRDHLEELVDQRTEALLKEKYYAESLVQTAQAIVLVLDTTGCIVSFNQYMEEISGYRLKEVQGKDWFSTFLPERDRNWVSELFLNAVNDIQTCGSVNSIVTKDGRERIIEWYDKTLKDEKGNTIGLLATGQDITERKRAEQALRESEERLRTVVEASLDAIIAVNAEGRFVLFNGAAQELFQYSEEEALNQPANILLREEIGKIHQERLEKFLERGVGRCGHIGRRMEKIFRRKDGSQFEAEVSMSGGRVDGLRLVVLAIHDITERRQAEDALHQSEENFRRSLDDSPMGVRIVTAEGETIYANRTVLDIFSIEELNTTPLIKRYTPKSYAEFQIRKEKRKRGDYGPSEYEVSIVKKDDEVRHLQVYRKEIFWNGERQFQVIYQDITERKQAEEKITASLREKETMLKEIHHRVKNNLQVISSLLSLQSSYLQDEKAREALDETMDRVETMASIHTQLHESQDLSRVDFGSFIRDLIGNIRQSYGRTDSPVEINIDAGEIRLGIDNSIPCGLILNELVTNAMKHAFPEGKEGEINIRMRLEDNQMVLTVCDNGIGFPESIDFTKVKTMGLDLVNLLAAQMNGEIEMQVDGGTTWTITFPVKMDREWQNE